MSKRNYRALISIPLYGDNDDEAIMDAERAAASLLHPGGGIRGHVELVTSGHREGNSYWYGEKVVYEDHSFVKLNLPSRLHEGRIVLMESADD